MTIAVLAFIHQMARIISLRYTSFSGRTYAVTRQMSWYAAVIASPSPSCLATADYMTATRFQYNAFLVYRGLVNHCVVNEIFRIRSC